MVMATKRKRKRGVVNPPDLRDLDLPVVVSAKRCNIVEPDDDDDVSRLLEINGFNESIVRAFRDHKIKLRHIPDITTTKLIQMGISEVGSQFDVMKWCQSYQFLPTGKEKVFNDPIHGHIELHPLLISIIDTRQFQRLRYIKQLGGGYYVFPGASHNRFEHSLGVSYLAGEFIESLQRRQIELNITANDVLCIKIAGLCHDLGHGPFSHMFDGLFIPLVNEDRNWKHEQASVDMLQYLIDDNNLWPQFESYNLTSIDLIFIKELIAGPLQTSTSSLSQDSSSHNWSYQGRPRNKSFLYEIVANKINGVDVDKWDYFARDCHCLGIPNNFDWRRYMKFARVIEVDGIYQICCRDKEVGNLYEMFHTRNTLHRRAYQHKTSNVVELMITEALVAANDHFIINGKNGHPVKMSEAMYDMVAYTQLTDSVIQQIMMSSDPHLQKAQQLLRQIEERRLYKCIGQTQPSTELELNETDIKRQIIESIENCSLTVDDLHIRIVSFDYGMKDKNPIDKMRFYIKSKPNKAVKVRKDQVSQMLPQTFLEKNIRVYCKKLDQRSLDLALRCFVTWCNKQDHLITPRGDLSLSSQDELEELSTEEGDFTPYGTPFGTPMKEEAFPQDQTNIVLSPEVKKRLSFTSQKLDTK